jgi:predicted  nucleic acid-binding Zn-ribbon protein
MGKTLMIEIDEATRGIMEDLQSSITTNVKEGVSSGLTRMIEDQQHQLVAFQATLATKLSTLEDEVSNSKKPLSRLSRDIEDTLRVVTNLQTSLNTKIEQIEQFQDRHLQEMSAKIEDIFHKALTAQQESAEVSMVHFHQETEKVNDLITQEVSSIKDGFKRLFADATLTIHQQYNSLSKQQLELAHQVSQLQTAQSSLVQLVQEQKFQFTAIQQEQQLAVEQIVATITQANNDILKQVNDTAPFERITELIGLKTNSVLNNLNQQPLLQKLDDIQKQLNYIRLPFYKKWFTRKEEQ